MNGQRLHFLAPMPRLAADSRAWVSELRRIEDLGFHAVAVSEHYANGWVMDALTAMNFALAATSRLRVMPLVLNSDLHHPAILAKAIATADVLSDGRAAVGIGAGWLADDYTALGLGYEPAAVRIARLEEALQVITGFFADQRVNFHGRYYQVSELEALPRPVRCTPPPVLVGGGGPRMLGLAGRYAGIASIHLRLGPGGFDEQAAGQLKRASVQEKIGLVAAAADRAGRRAPELQFTCYDVNIGGQQVTPVRPGFSDYIAANAAAFAGSPGSLRGDVDQCVDALLRWTEELGISYWHLGGNIAALAPIVTRLSRE